MSNQTTEHVGFGRAETADQPLLDPTAYGSGPDDAITDTTEAAAVTHHVATFGGVPLPYTAAAGHLVAVDPSSSKPAAKFFYVAFTADGASPRRVPVTFFYNGGPGSSSVYLLLGSFAPHAHPHEHAGLHAATRPTRSRTNPDSLLDRSDLVSTSTRSAPAIRRRSRPKVNRDFWGVDQDAGSLRQFIKRYLTAHDRWNSPKFLFGESYGTARSCVLA